MTESTPGRSRPVEVFPIRTDEDLADALKQIDALMDAKPGSDDEARLEVLSTLVEAYEEERFPIGPPDPVEAIRFRLEQLGLTPSALTRLLGSRARVSEVLNRRRALSKKMIVRLWEKFGIPLESLVGAGTRRLTSRTSPAARLHAKKKKRRGSSSVRARRSLTRSETS